MDNSYRSPAGHIASIRNGLTFAVLLVGSLLQAADFPLTKDSQRQPGVPHGEVLGPFSWTSTIYSGTVRNYWLYVPRQYNPAKKTRVFIIQDGLKRADGWHVPTVLDNLIYQGQIPVQIGVFVDPGRLPAVRPGTQSRDNRSFEYDSLGDRYARFLTEELLPEVKRRYHLSDDPNDTAIAGSSSGGICAMNAAWERPDCFRRVFSGIGTFGALRGGDIFPVLISKYEGRPIRVFLQDGSHNAVAWGGNGFLAGQSMLSALTYAGYDVQHEWGDGGHDDRHGAQVLPRALRFLWRDYPRPIDTPRRPVSMFHVRIPIPGEAWQEVSAGHRELSGLAANTAGEVFFSDFARGRIHKIDATGHVSVFVEGCTGVRGLAFGPDGMLYGCENGTRRVVRFRPTGEKETVLSGVNGHDLAFLPDGNGYFTDPEHRRLWRIISGGDKQVVSSGLTRFSGITVSADRAFVMVSDSASRYTTSFQIQPDGALAHEGPFGWLQLRDDSSTSSASGMTIDEKGATYVATAAGIQVLDGTGRLVMILNSPERDKTPARLSFGGSDFQHLYVTTGDKVFKRRIDRKGLPIQGS
jgi:sugar lactone lactonase YvrE/enterochelin esterase-like enzyme